MEEFISLKASLNEKIELLKRKLKDIRKQEETYNERKKLIDLNSEEEIGNKRKKEILSYYPEYEKKFAQLDKLKDYIDKIKYSEFDMINPFDFRLFITEINKEDSQTIIDDFRYLNRLNKNLDESTISDSDFVERTVKLIDELVKAYNSMVNDLRNSLLEELEKEHDSYDFESEKELISIEIDKITSFDIFDDQEI